MCPGASKQRPRRAKPAPAPEFFDDSKWYSAKEVAEKLSVSRDSVVRWGQSGEVRACKVGRNVRYSGADLNALMVPLGAGV